MNTNWKEIGHANNIKAMTALGGRIYAAARDNTLWARAPIDTDVNWEKIGFANDVVAMAALANINRTSGIPAPSFSLYAVTSDHKLWIRDALVVDAEWKHIGHANNVVAMTGAAGKLFAAASDNTLWIRDPIDSDADWTKIGQANNVRAMASMGGRLYASTTDNKFWARDARADDIGWKEIGSANDVVGLAALNGKFYAATPDHKLWVNVGESFRYRFSMDAFKIDNTRSRHEDTVYGSLSLIVGEKPAKTAKAFLGDLNNGDYHIASLVIDGVDVNAAEAVTFNYLMINSGHGGGIEEALTATGTELAKLGASAASAAIAAGLSSWTGPVIGGMTLQPMNSILQAVAKWVVGNTLGVLFANCDGPVAAEQISLLGESLQESTAAAGVLDHTTHHPGTDSAHGCGSNSDYTVTWSIRRV